MPFNIGNQNAGIVNNVEGDQTVHGGQSGTIDLAGARAAARDLRDWTARAAPADEATEVAHGIDAELGRREPRRDRVVALTERLVAALRRLHAAGTATAAAVAPLRTLLAWLGAAGVPLGAALAHLG